MSGKGKVQIAHSSSCGFGNNGADGASPAAAAVVVASIGGGGGDAVVIGNVSLFSVTIPTVTVDDVTGDDDDDDVDQNRFIIAAVRVKKFALAVLLRADDTGDDDDGNGVRVLLSTVFPLLFSLWLWLSSSCPWTRPPGPSPGAASNNDAVSVPSTVAVPSVVVFIIVGNDTGNGGFMDDAVISSLDLFVPLFLFVFILLRLL